MNRVLSYFLVFSALGSGFSGFSQGSGNSITFNGSNEYIRVNHSADLNISTTWTIEFWMNPSAIPAGWDALISKGVNDRPVSIWMYYNSIEVWYGSGTNGLIAYTNFGTVSAGEWQHVAATRNSSGTVTIYINGVQRAAFGGTSVAPTTSNRLFIGQRGDGVYYYGGSIDELRYWNVNRSQTQIRENMCKKLSGSESGLVSYWRFDDNLLSATATDDAGSNDGSLFNTPTRATSAAPVGNDATYLYTNSWAGQTLSLTSPEGDAFEVSNVTGSPDGVLIYRVDEVPNNPTGITGIGGNAHYYGVWKANGTSPTYTGTYDYAGNDGYQAGVPDADLRVYSRSNNAISSWTASTTTLDLAGRTLSATGLSTEFMLGSSGGGIALPIELLDFHAFATPSGVKVTWETATEINNDYFEVLRSADNQNWETLTTVPGQGNSRARTTYAWMDESPLQGSNYYRLKQVDFDGKSESFSSIAVMNQPDADGLAVPSIFPNPTRGVLQLVTPEAGEVRVFDLSGNLVWVQTVAKGGNVLDVSNLPKGVYSAHVKGHHQPHITRLVVQ